MSRRAGVADRADWRPGQKIKRLYAWIATEPDGSEGIPAALGAWPPRPAISARHLTVMRLREEMRQVQRKLGDPVRLLAFEGRREIAGRLPVPPGSETAGPGLKIERLYAWLSREPGGGEGLLAGQIEAGSNLLHPLVGADPARAESLRERAEFIGAQSGLPVHLVCFEHRVELERLADG
jgi:hypothetical protein